MTKCFAYIRVSGKGQMDGDGPVRQRLAIAAYAAAHDLEIVKTFEEAITGTSEWEDRPEWSAMVESLNGVRTILVERLDRLARELFVQEYILRDLNKREVTLVSTRDGELDDSDPTRVMVRQILGAVAEYDKKMIVLKLRGARQRAKARDGRCEGRKPYGDRPGESETLSLMQELRAAGHSLGRIVGELNAKGLRNRSGNLWTVGNVGSILEPLKEVR